MGHLHPFAYNNFSCTLFQWHHLTNSLGTNLESLKHVMLIFTQSAISSITLFHPIRILSPVLSYYTSLLLFHLCWTIYFFNYLFLKMSHGFITERQKGKATAHLVCIRTKQDALRCIRGPVIKKCDDSSLVFMHTCYLRSDFRSEDLTGMFVFYAVTQFVYCNTWVQIVLLRDWC